MVVNFLKISTLTRLNNTLYNMMATQISTKLLANSYNNSDDQKKKKENSPTRNMSK